MTPEERDLVIDLFDRLGTLEDTRRDPDAEHLIREGLRQAPNAVYSLVQTVLVQDEALKRADARIRELEDHAEAAPRNTSFLGSMRQALGARTGSVPSVRPDAAVSPAWRSERSPAPAQYEEAPPRQTGFTGGSFLGTAAAAAAGVIGGSLLLGSIRNMFGQSSTGQSAFGALADGNRQTPLDASNANSDLARSAGIDDIGRSPSETDGRRSSLLDSSDQSARDDTGDNADSFFGDGDGDVGSDSNE